MTSIIFMLVGCMSMLNMMGVEILGFIFIIMFMMGIFQSGFMGCNMSLATSGMGVDVVSYCMILLVLFLGLMMLFGESRGDPSFKILVILIMLILVYVFLSVNMLSFYLFFELVLIPMLLLIFIYGYQPERLESGIYSIMYTIFGSLPLLSGLSFMWKSGKSVNFFFVISMKGDFLFFSWGWLLMLGFLVKLPMYGLHIWLPKAHVEASVSGSMILAGVLLKLGCFGFYRFYLLIESSKMSSFFMIMGLGGSLMSVMLCFSQMDMKKLIAYSSVVHMGLFLGGVTSMGGLGLMGGLFMMLGHGFCSSGLFYFVNLLYTQAHSRSLLMVKGLLSNFPKGMLWGFLLVISNMAAPPFLNFFGEFMLGMSVMMVDLKLLSMILFFIYFGSVGYGIYFYSIISHGKGHFLQFVEIKVSEYYILYMHFWPSLTLIFLMKFM